MVMIGLVFMGKNQPVCAQVAKKAKGSWFVPSTVCPAGPGQ